MGAVAAPIAAVSSIASIGFTLAGSEDKAEAQIAQGQGEQAADNFKADQAEQAAVFGRLQAGLTDTTMREQLNTTLAGIDAVRASGNVDVTSPTTGAIEDFNRKVSDRQRTAAVLTQTSQAAADDASAAYLRKAGAYALTTANIGADATRMAGYASALGSLGKGAMALGGK